MAEKREDNGPKLSRIEILEILRHPGRIQADDVVTYFLKGVKYSTDLVEEITGEKDNLENRMLKMGLIGGEGLYLWDEKNYEPIVFVGQMKPKGTSLEDLAKVNYGYVSPEGLVFANQLYNKAEKENKKLLLLINTFGGAANNYAALKGQSWLISENIRKLLSLRTQIVSLVLGEGGSGGALQGQIGDKNLMLECADYSVIAPQHAATILKYADDDPDRIAKALELLKPMAHDMLNLGIVDKIVSEFPGGSHLEKDTGYRITMKYINDALNKAFEDMGKGVHHVGKLRDQRIRKALRYGETKGLLDRFGFSKKPETNFYIPAPISDKVPRMQITNPPGELVPIAEHFSGEIKKRWGIKKEENGIKCQGKIFYVPVNDELDYREEDCGWVLTEKTYKDNHKSCPNCGWGEGLSYKEWIRILTDNDSFEQFDGLKFEDFKQTVYHTASYLVSLEKARQKIGLNSGAVTGRAKIDGREAVFYLLSFDFMGGTLGIVEGEEFNLAAQRAKKYKVPLVGVFSSGGVRMAEGTLGLKQMEKNVAVTYDLKRNGKPFYSVLVSPCTAGILGSNASQGDVIIAEKYGSGNVFSFAGPRVVSKGGGKLDEYAVASGILKEIKLPNGRKAIDETVLRRDMKDTLSRYVQGNFFRKH
ncbi:hypothetical protein HYT23_06745 [Candidatus Pacearchaeota archaeon]|nr:hypothetical protein [Candidatus Pacearchaeota archaeon]